MSDSEKELAELMDSAFEHARFEWTQELLLDWALAFHLGQDRDPSSLFEMVNSTLISRMLSSKNNSGGGIEKEVSLRAEGITDRALDW